MVEYAYTLRGDGTSEGTDIVGGCGTNDEAKKRGGGRMVTVGNSRRRHGDESELVSSNYGTLLLCEQ